MCGQSFLLKCFKIMLLFVICLCHGSKLTWTMEPKKPKELTTPLVINCTFAFETRSRKVVEQTLDSGSDYYPYNISIANGDGYILASISLDESPKVKRDVERIRVEGRLHSKKSGLYMKNPYLQLFWRRLTLDLQGKYICLAHARDEEGHETLLKSELSVEAEEQGLDEMLNYLHKEAAEIEKIESDIELYHKEKESTAKYFAPFWPDMRSSLLEKKKKMEEFKNRTSMQSETGETSCYKLDSGNCAVDVSFKSPFKVAPIIIHTVRQLYCDKRIRHLSMYREMKGPHLTYTVTFQNMSRFGFTLNVFSAHSWYDRTEIHSIKVLWSAFSP